jgi:hypothetical protein
MVSDFVRSAGKAALIIAGFKLLLGLFEVLIAFLSKDGGSTYFGLLMSMMVLSTLVSLLSYVLLGLLPTYFYKRQKGKLTPASCIKLTVLALIFYAPLAGVFDAVISVLSVPQQGIGSVWVPFILISSILWQILTAALGFIPAIIGALVGFRSYADADEKASWRKDAKLLKVLAGAIICFILVFGVIFWQLGPGPPQNFNRASGFTVIKAFDRSIGYTPGADGALNATFINAGGTPVTITRINVSGDCQYNVERSTAMILDESTQTYGYSMAGGGTFKFRCRQGTPESATLKTKNKGDSFTVDIQITFTESVNGTTLTRTDSGRLTGQVE